MCTVSWLHTPGGYQLLSNRDERDTRRPALPPFTQSASGVRFIAPIDSDHSGSWIAVNEFGLGLSLVNRYRCLLCSGEKKTKPPSRGLLVTRLAGCASLEDTQRLFETFDLGTYLPFTVVALAPGKPALMLHWTGRDSLIECNGDSAMPLISSSFDPRGVEVYRKRLLKTLATARGRIDLNLLVDFHASHSPTPGAYSPCMHRDNARTVSFSRVTVAAGMIEFAYFPFAPCARNGSSTVDRRHTLKVMQMRTVRPKVSDFDGSVREPGSHRSQRD